MNAKAGPPATALSMTKWQKIAALNAGLLVGITASLFVVPPRTPLWIWGTASGFLFVLMNYLFFRRQRSGTREHKIGLTTTIAGSLGVALLLFELILRYLHR
jgi:hypothetical protein